MRLWLKQIHQPPSKHQGIHPQHADEHIKEIQRWRLHQTHRREYAQYQPQHPQHLPQQHRTAQQLLQQSVHTLVAVYALRPQPQLAFKIGIAVFEFGIDARRIAGEHMVLFLQAPHQLYVCHP